MTLALVTINTEYYPDPNKGEPISLGKVFVGKVDLDPEVEANRVDVVLRQEGESDVIISPAQQPLTTGSGGVVQYQGANAQLFVDGNYSVKVLRSDNTQAYYIADVLSGVSVARTETIIRFSSLSELRANGVNTDLTVWVDGHTDFEDGGQGIFHWDGSSGATDDDGVVIEIASTSVGRYIRSIPQGFSAGFYGLKTDGSDNTSRITAAVAAAGGQTIYMPPGTYTVLTGDFSGNEFFSYDQVVIVTNTTLLVNYIRGISPKGQYIRLSDTKDTGIQGGTSIAGTTSRALSLDKDETGLVTMSSNAITLPPGFYKMRGFLIVYRGDAFMSYIRNVTDSADLSLGSSEYSDNTDGVATKSIVSDEFSIVANKELEFTQFITTAQNNNGLGVSNTSGRDHLFALLEFWRISIL